MAVRLSLKDRQANQAATAVRDAVFEEATGEFVMCMDCHVFLEPGAIASNRRQQSKIGMSWSRIVKITRLKLAVHNFTPPKKQLQI